VDLFWPCLTSKVPGLLLKGQRIYRYSYLRLVKFLDYFKVVTDALNNTKNGEDCLTAVSAAQEQLSLMLEHPVGQRKVTSLFQLCDPYDKRTLLDRQNFFETLSGNFADVIQYNKDRRIDGSGNLLTVSSVGSDFQVMDSSTGIGYLKNKKLERCQELGTLSKFIKER